MSREMVTARLYLLGALVWADLHARPSTWAPEDWTRLMRKLTPREQTVVALHGIRGLTHQKCGEHLGVSRGRSDQLWRSACAKLQQAATEMHT